MLPADNRYDVLMDAAAWKRFPLRGHTITAHQGLLYVIGGKLKGGKDASSHIHILSLPHVLSKKPALKASVEVNFKIWDHAACLLPPNPLMPHGCICLVAGRAVSNLGFSNQAFLINLDPNSFDVLSVPIRSQSGSKAFVVRSGCALLPHPNDPKAIIMHGGRTAPGVETGKPHTTANGSQTILSDWHLLILTEQTSISAGWKSLVLQSAELQRRPCIQKADLAACKHCLWAVGKQAAGSKSTSFSVLVCGGSAALEHRPLSTVDVDLKSMSVSLRDASRAPGTACALTSSVCCTSTPGSQGNNGLFLAPIRKPQPAVGVVEVESQAEGRRWAVAQQRTLPLPACDAIAPLCVASTAVTHSGRNGSVAAQGNGQSKLQGVLVVAQGQVGQNRPVLYVWADPGIGGTASTPALHPAALRGGAAQQQLTSSYSGEYALPDSDPIRVEDLRLGRPTPTKAKNGVGVKHAVSAPASNSCKRKSSSTAAALETKRQRSSAPAPTTVQHGNRENAGDLRMGNGLQQTSHVAPAAGARKAACITAEDLKAAQQQLDVDNHVIQETPEVSLHDDLTPNRAVGKGHMAECRSDKAGAKSKSAPARRDESVMLSNAEVQQLRHQAQLTGRLESEVASLQQSLQEQVQHVNAAEEQVVNLKLQLNDLQAALARERACLSEARMLKDAALQREADCERRLQAAAQQTSELGKMKNDAVVQQNRMHEVESAREKLQARVMQLEHELALAQSARTRDVTELQLRANNLSKAKEDCLAQQHQLQEEKDKLEAECKKARAAGEQNQEQLETLRKKIEAADQKLEGEQQQRLQEVKELQEHHKGHVAELENRLRLEKVNRDTAEARHAGELQKCNGRVKYLEDVTQMCQEASDLSSKRADELAEQLQGCNSKLEAAQQEIIRLKEASDTHQRAAAQAQETVVTVQAEVTELRKELNCIKDKLQCAETKNSEHVHNISERDAQILQLRKQHDNYVVFYQDMMQAAQARQKAMESLSTGHASLSAAQKDEGEAFTNLAKKQAAAQHNIS